MKDNKLALIFKGTALAVSLLGLTGLSACGGGSTSESEADATTAFPSGLAIASPFDTTTSDATALSSDVAALGSGAPVSRYSWATGRIDLILSGTTPSLCIFDPSLFLRMERDADCYGPHVDYEAHPDAASSADPGYNGELPTGDVGLWMETSPSEGHACAAAELNARMEGVRDKSMASLSGFASLICTANANGIALPSNSTQDLTAEMNALGVADTTFSAASISHSNASGSDEWSYALDLEYSPGGDTHRIVVAMIHVPSGTAAEYQGRLTYRVNDSMSGGNCPSADITANGSLLYSSASRSSMNLEVRQATFCGSDVDGTTDGLVDPSQKYDPASNPDGWGNNFSTLTAAFDPSTMIGDFAYSWQAGPMDSNTRVFNIHTEAPSSGSIPDGQAFFGYGADIDGTDGGINGFICNWAGPGNSHALQGFAQSQEVSFDSSTGKYQSVSANIGYAPTNACTYDGTGAFRYDTDADGVVDTNAATAVANDLQSVTDGDTDGDLDEIEAAGFSQPASPSNI